MTDLTARLQAAALSLAGPGPIKERLTDAYAHLEDLEAADLPAFGDEFADMIKALHREQPMPGDSVVRASVRKLSSQDVRQYAELLVRLYGMAASIKHQRSAPRAVAPAAKFLVASGN
jgi:hypothetical protein